MGKNRYEWLRLAVSILVCGVAAVLSLWMADTSFNSWYAELAKPALQPPLQQAPEWMFGALWPVLYFLTGIALYLIWRRTPHDRADQTALLWFGVQLLIGVAWAWFFFALRHPFFGLIESVLLWLAVTVTTIAFFRLSRPAALLMLPYWLWASFLVYLMRHISRLN